MGTPVLSTMDLTARVLAQVVAELDAKTTTFTRTTAYSSSRIHAPGSTTAEPSIFSHGTHQRTGSGSWSPLPPSYSSTPPRYPSTPMELASLLARPPPPSHRLAPLIINSPELVTRSSSPESPSSAALSEIVDLYAGDEVPNEDSRLVLQPRLNDIDIAVHCPRLIRRIPVTAMIPDLDNLPTIPTAIRTTSTARNASNITVLQRPAASTTGGIDSMLRLQGKMSPKPEHPSTSLRQRAASVIRTASVNAIVRHEPGAHATRKTNIVPQHGTVQLFGKYARAPGNRSRAKWSARRVQRTSSKSGEETSAEETFYGADSLSYLHAQAAAVITPDGHHPWPIACGGNANIYRGKLTLANGHSIRVAIKMLRETHSTTKEDVDRRLDREVRVWNTLQHRNVLPFIGVCHDFLGAPCPALIAPFCKSGNVGTYLENNPAADRNELVLGVGSGLQFLHAQGVVHGDLSLANVLVDKQGVACICDFGISKILGCKGFTTRPSGTPQYLAPELFFVIHDDGSMGRPSPTTQESDVYAFALVALQILTSAPIKPSPETRPFTRADLEALRPRFSDYLGLPILITTDVWRILDECWAFEPETRPSISEVLDRFFAIVVAHRPWGK
ncbi:kinase-like domain-containing protein [Mycena amicta]|nr:kinase-like domain-containing protein [Mycena amicta]